jgi:hypothetical protein
MVNGSSNGGILWLKTVLAVLGAVVTALGVISWWSFQFILETRRMADLSIIGISANTAAQNAEAARIAILESEVHRIALTQAERTSTIQKMQRQEK